MKQQVHLVRMSWERLRQALLLLLVGGHYGLGGDAGLCLSVMHAWDTIGLEGDKKSLHFQEIEHS